MGKDLGKFQNMLIKKAGYAVWACTLSLPIQLSANKTNRQKKKNMKFKICLNKNMQCYLKEWILKCICFNKLILHNYCPTSVRGAMCVCGAIYTHLNHIYYFFYMFVYETMSFIYLLVFFTFSDYTLNAKFLN